MYTVIWIDAHGNDRWDRCESSEEVNDLLDREDARNGDTWVSCPMRMTAPSPALTLTGDQHENL